MSALAINPVPSATSDPTAELAQRCLYFMKMMREIEDRIERKLYRQGKVLGGVYVGRGQEAIPVGMGLLAAPDDALFPSHRDLALFLIRGVHPRNIFAQYMGRVGGLTRGRDVLAIHEAGRRAVAHARAGLGPYLIECKTFRMTGHSAHDAADYVPKHLWEEWAAKDPIPRLERAMIEKSWATADDIAQMNA